MEKVEEKNGGPSLRLVKEEELAQSTIQTQREIQETQDEKDQKHSQLASSHSQKEQDENPAPVQTNPAREYPGLPMPAQHLKKPGLEKDMELKPQFLAPYYEGSGKLQDQVAIITGGDSGIGRAIAVLFAREGADIALIYLNESQDAQDTCQHVEREGRRCLLIPGDVKDQKFCDEAVRKTVEKFGKLNVLVNNAAFQAHAQSLLDISEEHFDETLKTNVYGYFHMAKAVLPHLEKGASIVNTGSVTGLKGSAELLDYSATKGAIHAFTMALASNLLEKGIRVNAVAPGPVWTPLNPADKSPEQIVNFGKQTDFHRPAQPEEIAPAYVFLASPACSSYITGIVLPVTGSVGG